MTKITLFAVTMALFVSIAAFVGTSGFLHSPTEAGIADVSTDFVGDLVEVLDVTPHSPEALPLISSACIAEDPGRVSGRRLDVPLDKPLYDDERLVDVTSATAGRAPEV